MKSSHRDQLFDLMSQGIWQVDAAGKTTFVNARMAAMLGYSPEEFLPLPSLSLVRAEDRAWIAAKIASRRSGVRDDYACQITHKNGSWLWISVEAVPLFDDNGQFDGTLALVTDITERRLREEGLQFTAERFRLSMEATNDGLWDWNVRTDEAYFSPGYYRMLGYEVDNFGASGATWSALIHPEDRELAIGANMDCIEGRCETFAVEYRMRAKNGEWRWILGRGKCVTRDATGRALRLLGTHVDITDRRRTLEALQESQIALQLSESQTQKALEIGHAGSWHFDVKTGQIWGSAEGLRMFGYSPVARYWPLADIEVCIPDRERVHQALVALLGENQPYDLEYAIQPADGSPPKQVHSVATVARDADGEPTEVLGFVQDITERKRAEDKLRTLAAELTEANRLKDIFTDVLRHDIVNPAGAIQSATDVLLKTETDEVKTDVLKHIRQAAKNLIEMTDLASKLAAVAGGGGLAFFPADPIQALRSVVRDLQHKLAEKNMTLTDHSGAGFSANFHPIVKEVFANLIANAIKYSPSGTHIDVCAEDRGVFWIFSVKDQGIGVPDQHKQSIFHRFKRVGREGVRGTGLGLAITEEVVSLHRGRAWVEDNPTGGSTFFVRLPKTP